MFHIFDLITVHYQEFILERNNKIYIERWKGSKAVVILVFCCIYLLSCLCIFDVFTMFSGKPMGAVSVFMQGTTSANLEEDDGVSFLAEVVIAACYFLSFPDLQKIIAVKTLPLSKSFPSWILILLLSFFFACLVSMMEIWGKNTSF